MWSHTLHIELQAHPEAWAFELQAHPEAWAFELQAHPEAWAFECLGPNVDGIIESTYGNLQKKRFIKFNIPIFNIISI